MAQVKLIPFNMELATYENTHPEESDMNYDEFPNFLTAASEDGDLHKADVDFNSCVAKQEYAVYADPNEDGYHLDTIENVQLKGEPFIILHEGYLDECLKTIREEITSEFSTAASKGGFDLIRVNQIRIDIPIDVLSQIKDIKPAFIVYAGNDSMMECIGYPHGKMIYKVPAPKQPTYCIFGNVTLINGGVIINQFDVCDNCTVALFNIDHYREAQFFSMDPRRNDGISIEDLEQYAEEVLNLKFEEDE